MYFINNNWEQINTKEDLQRVIETLNPEIANAFEKIWYENISIVESDSAILQDDYDILDEEYNDMLNRVEDLEEQIEKWKDKYKNLKEHILKTCHDY